MKKTIFLLLTIAVTGFCTVSAQGGGQGGGMRRSPEERAKMVMDKFADWKLEKDKWDQTDSVFVQFYRTQQKTMQEMRENGGGDREKMMETFKKLADERDARLKNIFTADQYKKWKDEIEPTTRPQRGPGGGGPGGGGNGGGGGNN